MMSFAGIKRLGAQGLGPDDRVVKAVERGKPAVFKVVNPDQGWIEKLHQASPNTALIGRIVDNTLQLTPQAGRDFAERVIQKAKELGDVVKWWEGSNEAAKGKEAIKRLCEFEQAFAERLQGAGYHALVGGFSTGTPEIVGPENQCPWMEEWELLYPAMKVAHGVHFHEYWEPHKLDDTWNAYRFEKWWPALPEWARNKWWLVSELGVDGGPRQNDPDDHYGWRDYDHITAAVYKHLLWGYAQTMANYPRLAAAVYIAGLEPVANPKWKAFDICGWVLSYLKQEWAVAPAEMWGSPVEAPPPPPPPEEPEPVAPPPWDEATQEAWQSVIVSHDPRFAFPKKAKAVLGSSAFALSGETYFELGGTTWVSQLWSDGQQVTMLLTIQGQWKPDQIKVVSFS